MTIALLAIIAPFASLYLISAIIARLSGNDGGKARRMTSIQEYRHVCQQVLPLAKR